MQKKIWLIVEISLWLLLIAGNAGAFYLLKMQESDGKTVKTDGNTVHLPDGTIFTAKHEGDLFEVNLQNGKKKTNCVSDGKLWHCSGIWNGKKYDFSDDGKTKFFFSYDGVSVADFNNDRLMDIKTDGDSKYIFTGGQWLKCKSWNLGDTKTARLADGGTYQWSGSAWQK